MMRWGRRVSDEDLVAFAEGRLGRRARRRVAAHLREQPADGDRVRAYIGQDARLHQVYDPILEEPVPARLQNLLERPSRSMGRRVGPAHAVAVSALVLAIVVIAVGIAWDPSASRHGDRASEFAEAVLAIYTTASGTPSSTGRVRAYERPPAPSATSGVHAYGAIDFAQLDLQRETVRDLRHGSLAFREHVFRDARGTRVVLYESDAEADTAVLEDEGIPHLVERRGTRLIEWIGEDGRRYALVADQRSPAALRQLARQAPMRLAAEVPTRNPESTQTPVAVQTQGALELSPQTGPVLTTPDTVVADPGPHDM